MFCYSLLIAFWVRCSQTLPLHVVLFYICNHTDYGVPNRYVSRVNYLDSSKHAILGTQQFRPKEFASQIALNMDNAWGILRCIIDTCMKLPDGKYLILKDPLKVKSYEWVTVLTGTLLTCFSLECKGNVNIAKGKGLFIIVLYANVSEM